MSSEPEQLESVPRRFTLFGALRLIEARHSGGPRLGQSRRPSQDPVRAGQQPHLWFTPSDVTGYLAGSPATLNCASFGLFGPNGALPLHLTEYAVEREQHHRDPTFSAFADVFHHRMISLFYRAWADAQPAAHRDRPRSDRFASYAGALTGQGTPAVRNRTAVSDLAVFHRAGRFGAAVKSAEGLEDILSDYFGQPFAVVSYVPRWLEIPRGDRLVLGRRRCKRMGLDANLGGRSWQCQFGFRLMLGPLNREGIGDFLPGGAALTALGDLVRRYTGDELVWQLEILLQQGQENRTSLGREGRLAWNAWMGRGHGQGRFTIDGTRWSRPQRLAKALRCRARQRVEECSGIA